MLLTSPFAQTLGALATAFVLGTMIGFERQWRQRNAGLRTNVLVAVGSAAFADLGLRLLSADGATRIVAYVVSGIGFLGAGVILKDGASIRGLNTAATLWCSAAVGAFAGSGMPAEAAALAFFVLAGNTLLRPLVRWVDRRPVASGDSEAVYRVHAICEPEAFPTCATCSTPNCRWLRCRFAKWRSFPTLRIRSNSPPSWCRSSLRPRNSMPLLGR